MSLKKIVKAPNAILRKSSKPVKNIDESVKNLIQDMLDTMYNASGVGLAAVQVGILSRIVVIDTSKDDNKKNVTNCFFDRIVWGRCSYYLFRRDFNFNV